MRKIPYSHRGGVNNGKIFLIRTAVKHRRGANNEKIILDLDLDVYYSTPLKGVERVGLVQFVCWENWLLAEILRNSCFKLVFFFNFLDV